METVVVIFEELLSSFMAFIGMWDIKQRPIPFFHRGREIFVIT